MIKDLEELKKTLCEMGYEDVVVFDNPAYVDAFIGISSDNRAIYDYEKMIHSLMDEDNMEYEEAMEFVNYNTIRALPYIPYGPIVMFPFEF